MAEFISTVVPLIFNATKDTFWFSKGHRCGLSKGERKRERDVNASGKVKEIDEFKQHAVIIKCEVIFLM